MFCSLSLMAEDKAFCYSIDSIAPWNLKFEESKRIGLTWLDFGDYANAYYYLTSAYDQDGADADVRVGLDRASYYMNRKSFVSTYSELTELINRRFNSKEIMFKALKDKGEFLRIDELKEKTLTAILHASFLNACYKPFALDFNEMHNIGKIIFKPMNRKKIDLNKHIK